MIRGVYLRERKAIKIQRRTKLMIAFVIVMLLYKVVFGTFSIFRSEAVAESNIAVSVYIFDEQSIHKSISLDPIEPGEEQEVVFTVANYINNDKGEIKKISQTDMEYNLTLTTTTNLPLTYTLSVNGEDSNGTVTKSSVVQDSDGTIFQKLVASDDSEYADTESFGAEKPSQYVYKLKIEFPDDEKYRSSDYAELFDAVELNFDSYQIVDE